MKNGYRLQPEIEKVLKEYGFAYGHTLDSYRYYYFKKGWQVVYDPDEFEFFLEQLDDGELQSLRTVCGKLEGNDLKIETIREWLDGTVEEIDIFELGKSGSAKEKMDGRIKGMSEWLKKEYPHVFKEQKHLDVGNKDNEVYRNDCVERVYWHYGYLVALRDIKKLLEKEKI